MRIGIGLATAAAGRRVSQIGGELSDYEKAGVEVIFVPELYGMNAVSRLGYVAARTMTATWRARRRRPRPPCRRTCWSRPR